MRFLVDESTGSTLAEYLRSAGHDVLVVAEAMPGAEDHDVLSRTMSEARILVTNDKDSGGLVFRSGQAHSGVLVLRLHDESTANRIRVVRAVLEQHADRPAHGFVVATEAGVRIRSHMSQTRLLRPTPEHVSTVLPSF